MLAISKEQDLNSLKPQQQPVKRREWFPSFPAHVEPQLEYQAFVDEKFGREFGGFKVDRRGGRKKPFSFVLGYLGELF